MEKETKKCDCLFCQMTCPKCGEWDGIRVSMNISMDLYIDNDTFSYIRIDKEIYSDDIEVDCESCGYEFSNDEKENLKLEIYNNTHLDESTETRCEKEAA